MELKLDVVRTRGRAAVPLTAEVGRPLAESDLLLLETERGVQAKPLTQLRAKHHALARALASGMSEGQAALTAGYSLSRVSVLKDDPAFQQLMAFYRRDQQEAYRDFHERLADIGTDAVDILHERLEEDPGEFSNTFLLELVTKTADRTGYGPSSKTTNVNVNIGVAQRLEAARKRRLSVMRDTEDAEILDD